MSIVTRGLGGNCLITQGLGWWHRIVEKVKAVVSRLVPKRRVKVLMRIPVAGSPVHKFEMTVPVDGHKDFFPFFAIVLDEEEDEE